MHRKNRDPPRGYKGIFIINVASATPEFHEGIE